CNDPVVDRGSQPRNIPLQFVLVERDILIPQLN
ncbi:MAG: hypothetical protein EZS28_040363, partial [Streblomastix strix]